MRKLTLEQSELLNSLLEHKEELRILYDVIEQYVSVYESAVNKVSITDQSSERDLLYRRLKAEGARKLLFDIGQLFNK